MINFNLCIRDYEIDPSHTQAHTRFSGIGGGGSADAAEDGLGVGGRQVEGLDPGHVGHEVAVQGVEVGDLECNYWLKGSNYHQ